jgi:hypothetical protein
MAQAAEPMKPLPASVSPTETALQQRMRPIAAAGPQALHRAESRLSHPDTTVADQLASTMRLVKAARFTAATRLERKQAASLFTQSMVALYFVGLAVWQAVYLAEISDSDQRLLTFISIVSSVFTLILGLLEAMNDYQMKAHHLQNCALTVSELAQELRIARPTDPAEVQEFRRRYNEALKACPVNHDRIDYLFAKQEGKNDRVVWAFLWLRYAANVYGLYAFFLLIPPLLWYLHH